MQRKLSAGISKQWRKQGPNLACIRCHSSSSHMSSGSSSCKYLGLLIHNNSSSNSIMQTVPTLILGSLQHNKQWRHVRDCSRRGRRQLLPQRLQRLTSSMRVHRSPVTRLVTQLLGATVLN